MVTNCVLATASFRLNETLKDFEQLINQIEQELKEGRRRTLICTQDDPVLEKLTELSTARSVMDSRKKRWMPSTVKVKHGYSRRQPPGYMDANEKQGKRSLWRSCDLEGDS